MELVQIATIRNGWKEKFGIPRQSSLIEEIPSRIVFEKEFRDLNAIRGMEGFSHLWLIWGFSANKKRDWSPTVKPPRLGGNARMGVFATRSPYRPNPIGLSCVRLISIDTAGEEKPVLTVAGADLMDGTPIYDIKPFLPFADNHPDAFGGFADEVKDYALTVNWPEDLQELVPEEEVPVITAILQGDPRPAYKRDREPERIYGVIYNGKDIRFRVKDSVLTVCEIVKL